MGESILQDPLQNSQTFTGCVSLFSGASSFKYVHVGSFLFKYHLSEMNERSVRIESFLNVSAEHITSSVDGSCEHVPCVAFFSEYDALPELGHACGHNLIAVVGVASYIKVIGI